MSVAGAEEVTVNGIDKESQRRAGSGEGCPGPRRASAFSLAGVPSGSGRARGIGTEVRARTHNPAMSMFAMPFFCLRNLPNTVSCSKDWLGVAIVVSARPRPSSRTSRPLRWQKEHLESCTSQDSHQDEIEHARARVDESSHLPTCTPRLPTIRFV